MSRKKQNGQHGQGRSRGRRRDRDPAAPLRRPPRSYGDESRRVIYVAAEGTKTEQDYVALLNTEYGRLGKFHLHFCAARHGLRPSETVGHVLAATTGPEDEKWVLFDRDAEDNRDDDIPEAMREAAEHGVQVALSHPAFELWLLLHFQQFTSQEGGRSATVLNRLRSNRDAEGFADYDQQSGDRGKGLDGRRGQSLQKKEGTAVRNARQLVARCPHGECSPEKADHTPIPGPGTESYQDWTRRTGHAEGCDPLRRDPSSDVWRLLVHLGIGTETPENDGRSGRKRQPDEGFGKGRGSG